ncbi:peptide-methionine (S)-S-oxide reductase MsrA [Lysobacter sp. A286]
MTSYPGSQTRRDPRCGRQPRKQRKHPLRRAVLVALLPLLTALAACAQSGSGERSVSDAQQAAAPSTDIAVAVFAGGCFWCMEPPYDQLPGVLSTTSGYIGGTVANPTYEQVSAGTTGHAEAVQVKYDPRQVSYEKLLEVFWHNIDPVAVDRQFCDIGDQYRSAIFTIGEDQQRLAEASKRTWQASGRFERPIATQVVVATTFYPAETYHQDYYEKNPIRYRYYRFSCGRDGRLEELWGSGS